MSITITITSGRTTFNREYVAYRTTAPVSFDGFGTVSVHETLTERCVLIQPQHLAWQTERYASGLHPATEVRGADSWLAEKILKAIPKGLAT